MDDVDFFNLKSPALKSCYSGPGDLLTSEIFWREHYAWLASQGYTLRSRYDPDWIPSWTGTNGWWFAYEDGQTPSWNTAMDATRESDGAIVMLKKVRSSRFPREVAITSMFSAVPIRDDSANHCVPVLDVLAIPETRDLILVMPYLFDTRQPCLETVGEAVEFLWQVLEGLEFMHNQHVAHRTVRLNHILMDAAHLYDEPFHPVVPAYTRDLSNDSPRRTRTENPVRYYFIDFGLSRQYSPKDLHPKEYPPWDGARTVPEYWTGCPADPFAADVYCMGQLINDHFLQGPKAQKGFKFMEPLVAIMMNEEPSKRPRMQDVTLRFKAITHGLNEGQLRSRLATKDENLIVGIFRSVFHWIKQVSFMARGLPAQPKL
ncbi:kinase-like domain-containing protein [Mycena floridula]|nr:kinase-like domain-containing protein [Mycena floridula]